MQEAGSASVAPDRQLYLLKRVSELKQNHKCKKCKISSRRVLPISKRQSTCISNQAKRIEVPDRCDLLVREISGSAKRRARLVIGTGDAMFLNTKIG